MDELKLPDAVRTLARANNGLILVTGKTGSGKSTTLAAMIDDINKREKGHILTIEDPIEFVHQRRNCLISQREIGVHAPELRAGAALGAARGSRRDPGGRDARPRDHQHRRDRGRDGHPGHGHAAHQWRGADRGSHHQRISLPTSSRMCAPCCRPRCAAWSRSSCCSVPTSQGRVAALEILVNYAGGGQPDPPGQARPAREHHAVRRAPAACAPWTAPSRRCSTSGIITGQRGLQERPSTRPGSRR